MPVALVGIAGFALSLFAVLCATSVDWLITQIARSLGKFGVGPFSIDLGGIFSNLATPVLGWCVDQGKAFFIDGERWIAGHVYILTNLGFHTVSAISHLGDQVAHLYTVVIPDAIKTANADTESFVGGVENTLKASIKTAADNATAALGDFTKLTTTTIPDDLRTVASDISSAVGAGVTKAETYADGVVHTLHTYVDNQVGDAESAAASAVAALGSTLGKAIAGVASDAAGALTAAQTALLKDIDAVGAGAAAALANTTTTLTHDITSVADTAATEASDALTTATAEVGALGSKLTGTITSDVTSLTGDITNTAQTFAGDLSNVETVLKAAIASAVGVVALRVTKLEECSVQTCDDSPNNFTNLLNDALGIAEFASVFAFLSQAISDPAGAERDYSGVIQGLFQSGESLFDSLLSL